MGVVEEATGDPPAARGVVHADRFEVVDYQVLSRSKSEALVGGAPYPARTFAMVLVNIGGGVNGQFTENVGIRGDLRYFRSFENNEDETLDIGLSDFDFWRGSVGVSFRW